MLDYQFTIRKTIFWISCILSQKMTESPNFHVFVIYLIGKNAQDFWLKAFSLGFLAFFVKRRPYNALTDLNIIFWFVVGDLLTELDTQMTIFVTKKNAILPHFLTDNAVFDHFELK